MKTLIYIIGIFFLQTSCYQQEFHPESGDLIFQVGIAGGMTEAIADATGGESDLSFTHVGIITVEPAGIYVLEAASKTSTKHPGRLRMRLSPTKPTYRKSKTR